MARFGTVEYAVAEHVARITMDRPEKRNALNDELLDGLDAAFVEAERDPDVHAVVLAGNGPSFCSGYDLGGSRYATAPEGGWDLGNTVGTNPLTQNQVGGGFLGMKYSPFLVQNPGSPPENVSSPVDEGRTMRRAEIFHRLEGGLVQSDGKKPLMDAAHRASASAIPSEATSTRAIASSDGVTSGT